MTVVKSILLFILAGLCEEGSDATIETEDIVIQND